MAEQSGFFPDVNGDREYTTDFLADWVKSFISNGVYNGELAVTAGDGMTVKIPAGRAWINGYYYHNDSELTLAIASADGVLARKDTVVLRWDVNARNITAQVLTGTFASNPVAPKIVRNSEQYDLKLAEISIPAGTTKITQSLITDCRLDNDVCGIVHAVIDQIDTSTLMSQLDDWAAQYKEGKDSEFTAWFDAIKDQLSTDAAGHLQNQIDNIITGNISVGHADEANHAVVANSALPDSELDTILQTGWVPIPDCHYYTNDSFTIGKDLVTNKYLRIGDKIKIIQPLDDTTYETSYFFITNFAALTFNKTYVKVQGCTDYDYIMFDAPMTVYYSHLDAPAGWDGVFSYTPTVSCSGSMTYTVSSFPHANFRIDGRKVEIDVETDGTIGGTPSNITYISLPIPAAYLDTPVNAYFFDPNGKQNKLIGSIVTGKVALFSPEGNYPTGRVRLVAHGSYYFA